MRPVFILRNVAHETAGALQSFLVEVGMEVCCLDLFRETPWQLPLHKAAGLVVMGGPMSVHEVDQYPFLAAEVNWIRQAVEQQLATLGIRLGSQLLAHAMGAKVYPNRVKEIGWYCLEMLPAVAEDPLFAGCQKTETVFQWHGDTFDLPAGAVLLAQSALCKHQAFRVGPCAWGLQFHIEMTPDMVDGWLSEPSNCAELTQLDYIDPAAIRAAASHEFPKMQQLGQRVLRRFVGLSARRTKAG